MPATSSQLRSVKNLTGLVAYLRDELGWPVETDEIEDMTLEYQPEDLRLQPEPLRRKIPPRERHRPA